MKIINQRYSIFEMKLILDDVKSDFGIGIPLITWSMMYGISLGWVEVA